MRKQWRFWEFLVLAQQQLRRNKTRAILTMLGVIIGVSSVILLLAIGSGLKIYIRQQFESLGSNLIYIMPGQMIRKGRYRPHGELAALGGVRFDWQDIRRLERLPAVAAAAPAIFKSETAAFSNRESQADLVGTAANMAEIRKIKLSQGRFFNHQEETSGSRVVVIGAAVKDDLFSSGPALGKRIIVGGEKYKVIGIIEKQGGMRMMGMGGFDSRIYLPYKNVFRLVPGQGHKFPFLIVESRKGMISLAKQEAKLSLLRRYKEQDFSVTDQAEILGTINSILGVLTAALAGIAAISLLVGGIGIMNIMFVSVSERVKEIGLRKAIGATATDIQIQFLLEAVVLALVGGSIGVALGFFGALFLNHFFPAIVSLWSVVLAFAISSIIGIVFGVVPARRAAKLSPIDALHYE